MSEAELEALWLSLRVAGWSVAVSLPFGIAVAWLLARKHFPGKIVLDGLIHLPLVLPPVVVGYGLLLLLGRTGPVGRWLDTWFGVTLAFTWQGAAVAAAVMAFPLMVRAIRLSLEALDRGLEQAAATLGASPLRTFLTVTLPLATPGLVVGCVLAFARSLGEFGATIMLAGNIAGQTRTLPLAIYTEVQTPDGEAAALRLAALSVGLALAALLASEIVARRLRRRDAR